MLTTSQACVLFSLTTRHDYPHPTPTHTHTRSLTGSPEDSSMAVGSVTFYVLWGEWVRWVLKQGASRPQGWESSWWKPLLLQKRGESVQTQAMQIPQQAWRLQYSQKKSLHCNPGLKSTSHLGMAGKLPLQEKQTRVREILRNFCSWLCWMWNGNRGLPCKKTDSKHFSFYIFHLITDYFWTL